MACERGPAIKGYPNVCMWQAGAKAAPEVVSVCTVCVCTHQSIQRPKKEGAASGGVYGAGREKQGKALRV